MFYKRWYDKNPKLSELVSYLEEQDEEVQDAFAQHLLQILIYEFNFNLDEEISKIAWEKYGFRTGVTGTSVSTSDLGIGIPSKITSTVTSLKMNYYNELIEYLSK